MCLGSEFLNRNSHTYTYHSHVSVAIWNFDNFNCFRQFQDSVIFQSDRFCMCTHIVCVFVTGFTHLFAKSVCMVVVKYLVSYRRYLLTMQGSRTDAETTWLRSKLKHTAINSELTSIKLHWLEFNFIYFLLQDLDSYLKSRSPVTFLSDLRSNLQVSLTFLFFVFGCL